MFISEIHLSQVPDSVRGKTKRELVDHFKVRDCAMRCLPLGPACTHVHHSFDKGMRRELVRPHE